MKKFLKIFGITLISIVLVIYLSVLFIVPNVVDLNKFMPEIQKIAKEQANLNVDIKNPKLSITPLLSAGITTDEIKVTLPDDSELLSAEGLKARIALPSLLALTVKVSTAELIKPIINIDIVDGKSYKIADVLEEAIKNNEATAEQEQEAQAPAFDASKIKIKVPQVKIIDYSVKINDLQSNNFLKLRGDELLLGYFNGKRATARTNAELFVNDNKNINANIDIDTFLPEFEASTPSGEKKESDEIPFVNPVEVYMTYNPKLNIDTKLKIRNSKDTISSNGYFNIDNLTMQLSNLQLPESKIHIVTKGTNVDINSDLNVAPEQKISVKGTADYGSKPNADIKITSDEIKLDDILTLTKAALDSVNIKHELNPYRAQGTLNLNAGLKTDLKKLFSQGNISFKDCVIKDKNSTLAKFNSIISLDNNIIKFIDTKVEVVDTIFTVDGTIDEKTNADITVLMDKLPLEKVFKMFLPADINKAYTVNSGDINLKADITGELQKATGKVNLTAKNISLTDKVNKINYSNNLLNADFTSDFKTFKGTINNKDFKLSMNGANINCPQLSVNADDKDITIIPSKVTINGNSNIDISGTVKNYINNPVFDIKANGRLISADLKQLLGADLAPFINAKGSLPLKANITGDVKKQSLTASIDADANNYITPINISNVLNKNTAVKIEADLKGDKLNIKDSGFFIKNGDKLTEIITLDGNITKLDTQNPSINNIKIKTAQDLTASLCIFPKSKMLARGSIFVYGDLASPKLRGEASIWDMSIPELFITMDRAGLKLESNDLDVNITKLVANGSDYGATIKADLTPNTNFIIKSLNLVSNMTDADKLMAVSDASMKYFPQNTSSSSSSGNSSNASSDIIPVVVKDGSIDIKQIKSGTINLTNTTGKLTFLKNVVYINNLLTNGFDGKIKGDVSMNIITGDIKADVKGTDLNVEKTLLDAAAMKDTLTGTMDFDAKVGLRGATYEEQMKTLKGNVTFNMKNGSLGPFGRIENLISADNVKSSSVTQSALSSAIKSLLTFDTSRYNTLDGEMSFNNGIANITSIKSKGDVMSAYIFGTFNLLNNNADLKLRGKLGSEVTESLGLLAYLNPTNLVKANPTMGFMLKAVLLSFTEVVSEDEMNKIPSLSKEAANNNATMFQAIIRGNVEQPVKVIKSFKWLTSQSDLDNAKSFSATSSTAGDITQNLGVDVQAIKADPKGALRDIAKGALQNAVPQEKQQAVKTIQESVEKAKKQNEENKALLKDKEALKSTLKSGALNMLKNAVAPQEQSPSASTAGETAQKEEATTPESEQ